MGGGEGDSQAGGVAGDGGVADGGGEKAVFGEGCGGGEGSLVFPDDDGEDGAGMVFAEKRDVLKKFFAQGFTFGGADEV